MESITHSFLIRFKETAMAPKTKKMIITPIDGSKESLRALSYLNLYFKAEPNLKVVLLYILPSLPPMLVDECKKDPAAARKLKELEKKNSLMAEQILEEAKTKLAGKGFDAGRIETVYRTKENETAHDICWWAASRHSDAIVLNTRSRSRLEAFFMGETARKVLEFAKACPVWLIKGSVKSRKVLIAMDGSDSALRAVEHAGFILAGTDCSITLFHSKRKLERFLPKELLEGAAELEELWKNAAATDIAPTLERAQKLLLERGVASDRVSTKIIEGSRSAAADILKAARKGEFGTIVMGRKGVTADKDSNLGSITRKVVQDFTDMAVWVVR